MPANRSYALAVAADDRDRSRIRSVVQSLGWELRVTGDGGEVRRILAGEAPPVVILDIDTPAIRWRDLLVWRPDPGAGAWPRFVLVSRLADDELWAEVLNLGAFDLLAKPLNTDELEWAIRCALADSGSAGAAGAAV